MAASRLGRSESFSAMQKLENRKAYIICSFTCRAANEDNLDRLRCTVDRRHSKWFLPRRYLTLNRQCFVSSCSRGKPLPGSRTCVLISDIVLLTPDLKITRVLICAYRIIPSDSRSIEYVAYKFAHDEEVKQFVHLYQNVLRTRGENDGAQQNPTIRCENDDGSVEVRRHGEPTQDRALTAATITSTNENAEPSHVRTFAFTQAFANNSAYLVEKIYLSEQLLYTLLDSQVLSQAQIDEINTHSTSSRKNAKLLEILKTRPDRYYRSFLDALQRTEQEHIADVLESAEVSTQDEDGMPSASSLPGNTD